MILLVKTFTSFPRSSTTFARGARGPVEYAPEIWPLCDGKTCTL